MGSLEKALMIKIDREIEKGQEYFLEGNFQAAVLSHEKAIGLIPIPKHSWNESWSFYYGISEIYFQNQLFEMALNYLKECLQCPNALGNPHVHLRIGQIRYEFKEFEKAKDELMRAFMGGTLLIFEKEDKKYLDLIREFI